MTDQERLENLEKRLAPSLAKFARTYGKIDLYDDIAQLLERAKLVRNLENANKSIIDEMDRLMIARAEMEFKHKNAEHELEYYKNKTQDYQASIMKAIALFNYEDHYGGMRVLQEALDNEGND